MSWVQYQRESAFIGMGHASIYLGHLLLRMGHAHARAPPCGVGHNSLAHRPCIATRHHAGGNGAGSRSVAVLMQCARQPISSTEAGGALRAGYARALGRQGPSLGGEDTGRGPVRPGDADAARHRVARSAASERRQLLPLAGMHGAQLHQCCWESRAAAKAVRKGMTANACALRAAAEMRAPKIVFLNPFAQAAVCRSLICTCER